MKCPNCESNDDRVVDSRPSDDGSSIRRRRECLTCGTRFTTYEKIDTVPLMVIKKDKRREPFDSVKLRGGILKACEKRPISLASIDALVRDIEMQAYGADQEITSQQIGEMAMDGLKELDEVAYLRFASVYRSFESAADFEREIEALRAHQDVTRSG